ncbi:MAG: U32 family peptidase [Bacteroidaceae bacterium]|nr:U32 family peptidase [Bacteroidaceae bacterium]
MRAIELLAPARDLECGIEAIRHGADAVYIGAPRFGARAAAGNSLEDIARLVDYAHLFGVRIYVTLNTLLRADELPAAQSLINDLTAIHVDALITQDPRIIPSPGLVNVGCPDVTSPANLATPTIPSFAPSSAPPTITSSAPPAIASSSAPTSQAGTLLSSLPLHSSTQQDNRTPADVLARLVAGYQQVVLARELSLDEIRAIHAAVPQMPLEVFVHGALCVSYSGRCYASEYCFGRSANRGECAQFCRLPFDLVDDAGHVVQKQRHLLSLRDMNRAADLEALMDAGVTSFKIEGRLKDVAYVKNTTAYHRQQIDAILQRRSTEYRRSSFGHSEITFTPDPAKSFNRGFTTYFLHGRTTGLACHATPKSIGEFVGTVKEITISPPTTSASSSHSTPTTKQASAGPVGGGSSAVISFSVAGTSPFTNGDGLCFFTPDDRLVGFRVNRVDQQGRLYPASIPEGFQKGTRLYRNYDAAFERLLSRPTAVRRLPVRWLLEDHETGFRLTLTAKETGISVSSYTFEQSLETAYTPQEAAIRRQLLRLGETPFACSEEDIELRLSDNFFIPASVLANWRRQLTEELCIKLSASTTTHTTPTSTTPSSSPPAPSHKGEVSSSSPTWNHVLSVPLMTCRYCLRHALGQCLRQQPTLRGSLSLQLADGRRFPLHFDCRRCEMYVMPPAGTSFVPEF